MTAAAAYAVDLVVINNLRRIMCTTTNTTNMLLLGRRRIRNTFHAVDVVVVGTA